MISREEIKGLKNENRSSSEREEPMDQKYYTPQEVADMFKTGRRRVYEWIKTDKIAAIKMDSSWRISEEAIEEFTLQGNMAHFKKIAAGMGLTIEGQQDKKTRLKGYRIVNADGEVIAGENYSLSFEDLAKAIKDLK